MRTGFWWGKPHPTIDWKVGLRKLLLVVFCGLVCFGLAGCGKDGGTVEVYFTLNEVEGVVPSYQTVVWLEDEGGAIVHSALVSEYLSMGGNNKEGVCSSWSGKSGWSKKKQKEVMAVTRATPKAGATVVKVDCGKAGLEDGRYRYFVEVHIVKDYNVVYSGEIVVGAEDDWDVAKVKHVPKKHDKGSGLVSDVRARYYR